MIRGLPVFFFLLDVIPDYIQKTFGVDGDGRFQQGSEYYGAVLEGEKIPDWVEFAVVVYNTSNYHATKAINLQTQIQELHPGAKVMLLPVRG